MIAKGMGNGKNPRSYHIRTGKKKKKFVHCPPIKSLKSIGPPHLTVTLISSCEVSESLPELETDVSVDPIAFSSCEDNLCKRFGRQQQQCQPVARTSERNSAPRFFLIQLLQNNILQDLQLTSSLLPPHHAQ